jgi:tetratricopeptide (TPR) repeat protein
VEAVSTREAVLVSASLSSNRDAARLYSEGLARLRVFDALEARDLLQQAVAADPKFALAHSALAEAWSRLGYDKKAQMEARQAYELSANLSREEKLVVEGRYRDIDHENEKAIEVYRALFTLFPDSLDYGLKLARAQIDGGKGQNALATVDSVRKLAPPASEDPRIELTEADARDAVSDYKHEEQPLVRAVEKARAQGSRLFLAEALENQCWMLHYSKQLQNTVSACREARDTYAAAGDQQGEATALRAWANAISEVDAPESIRLYKQAGDIFRRNGSEQSMAKVLNDLGVVYEQQGDPVTAEKMYREALAGFRLVDNKRAQAAAIGNAANARKEQGDLLGAAQLYEQTLQLAREVGDTGIAAIAVGNLADVRRSQGDLARAKQGFEESLAASEKIGNQDSSARMMVGLGALLFDQADFSGARKMFEQARAIWTPAGDKLSIARTQTWLADLSLEEQHSPAEQEVAIRQALEVFQQQGASDDETLSLCSLARALLAEGKVRAAKKVMQHARSLAAKSQERGTRWDVAIVTARVETADKNAARSAAGIAARKELTAIIAKSRELGYQGFELEARLALAEIEMRSGQREAGRAHLTAVETDANAKGFNLIAHKAAIARG